MLNDKIINLINFQINAELESAYLYLDCANYFNERGLSGFEHWYKVQAREEIEHAEKFIDYLHDENEKVKLMPISEPKYVFDSDQMVLDVGLNHEIYVTGLINDLYYESKMLDDNRTMRFLDWFITEQAEEEKNANDLKTQYEMFAKDCGAGLYQMDRELGRRKAD